MASSLPSSSIRMKAQVILTCQLCQRSSPLKWKCIDCDILMCDNCKTNVHARVKTATRHEIVDIKEIGFTEPKQASVDLDNIPCKAHPKQSCCVYCVQCKELICPKCLTKIHKGHDVEEIETQYNENLEHLRKNISGNIDPHDFHIIFGSFDKLSITANPKEIKLTRINTYETSLPIVDRLVTTSVNSVWITCLKTTILQEMQIAQRLIPVHEYNDKRIYDMKISKAGDLLFTIPEDTNLYRLSKTGQINTVHDFSPLLPKAIHAKYDSLIISTREKGDAFPLNEHSRRQIVVLDQTGRQKVSVIEYDKQNKRLFSLISSLEMDNTGNIVSIDSSSDEFGRIVQMDKTSIKWAYEGISSINTEETPFNPRDITISQCGNIIVADEDTHSLHILLGDGILMKCCMMEDIDIILPFSLDIDSNGNLWIGCRTYEDSEDNAKIHKLEISGC